MAGGGSSYEDEDGGGMIADINVTPLVDITLVLLIVFMITVPSTLALTLQRDPAGGYTLYANGEKTDETQVKVLIPSMLVKNKELQAIIAADKGIAYGDVVHVVDLVKALGVHKFALNTDATAQQ